MAGGSGWRDAAIVAAPVALALVLRIHGLDWGRPALFEEAVPLHRAWAMWSWDPGDRFDGHPHDFRYPTLVLYLNLLLQAATYGFLRLSGAIAGATDFRVLFEVDPPLFFVPARGLSVLFAVGCVWMTMRLGRRLHGPRLGATAAVLVAANAFHVDSSQLVIVDMPLAFLSLWALWRCALLAERVTIRNGVTAGVAIGLAASAKYTGALLVIPWLVAWMAAPGSRRGRARVLALAAGAAAIAFASTSPWVLADLPAAWRDVAAEREHMELGHFGSAGGAALGGYARDLFGRLLGPGATVAAAAGMILLAAIRRDRRWIVLASFVVAYGAIVGSWSMSADRYLLPLVAPLLLFAAIVPVEAARWAGRRGLPEGVALAVVAMAVALPPARALPSVYERALPDSRHRALSWVEASLPAGSLIVTEAYGPPVRTTQEQLRLRPEILVGVRRALSDRPVYAVVTLPLSQVHPETSAPFYDLRLHRDADAIIVTDDVSSRYAADPTRFPRQNAFYDSLESRFRRVREIPGGPGPRIRIYVSPVDRPPFAKRPSVEGPAAEQGDGGGLKPGFHFDVGFAYETGGFFPEALTAYALGLKSPLFSPGVFGRLSMGTGRCLARMGRAEECAVFLESAEQVAPWPDDRAAIRDFRTMLPARGPR